MKVGKMGSDRKEKELEKQKREDERLERVRQKEAEKLRKEEEKKRREEERLRKEAEKEQERLRKEEEKRKKEEERLRKEEEKRKKDEEKEQERLKKEEEKKKKDEEKEQERLRKEEEKRKKDDEKEQERFRKEEEKRKKDEEKEQERIRKEQKTKRQAEFMHSFLKKTPVPSTSSADVSMEVESPTTFKPMPFQVKTGMALAPVLRRLALDFSQRADFAVETEIEAMTPETYLLEIKTSGGRKSLRTEVVKEAMEEDVMIIDPRKILIENPTDSGLVKRRYKLLQFHTNVRPAYWGTWKRKPICVKPRSPFLKEPEVDYEFDSDDEWEEEPEDGEELGDKDDADKEEDEKCAVGGEEEDIDEEDDFLVPHGYLSDDEGGDIEYRDKDTLKSLEEEFYRDLKRETINRFPIIETDDLEQYRMIFYPDTDDDVEVDDQVDMELDEEPEDDEIIMLSQSGSNQLSMGHQTPCPS